MRHHLILALLFCSYSFLSAQYDIEWEIKLGEELHTEFVNDLLVTSDGNYLTVSNGNSGDAYLALISSDREVIWQNYYHGTSVDRAHSAVEVSDGFVFLGVTNEDQGFNSIGSDIWMVKVDKSGNVIWKKTYNHDGTDYGIEIISAQDGGFAVLSLLSSNDINLWNSELLKFDSNGELVWFKNLSTVISDDINLIQATKILQSQDGSFVICGDIYNFISNQYTSQWLIKISNEGETIWSSSLDEFYSNCRTTSFLEFFNGDYLIAGYCDGNGWVARLDDSGEVIWKNTIGGLGQDAVHDILLTENETILGVGESTSDASGLETNNTDILIFELNEEGEFIWFDTTGENDRESARQIVSVSNNCFVIATNSGGDITVMKLSLETVSTTTPDPTSTLRLFPNPAHDIITIEVGPKDLGLNYAIYNNQGQLITEGKIESRTTTISTVGFSRGIYTFNLADYQISRNFIQY